MMPRATSSRARLALQHASQRPAQLKPPFGSGSGPPHWWLRTRRVSSVPLHHHGAFLFLRAASHARSPALMPHGIHLRLSIPPLPPSSSAACRTCGCNPTGARRPPPPLPPDSFGCPQCLCMCPSRNEAEAGIKICPCVCVRVETCASHTDGLTCQRRWHPGPPRAAWRTPARGGSSWPHGPASAPNSAAPSAPSPPPRRG